MCSLRGLGVGLSPLAGSGNGSVLVFLPALGDVVGERIVGVGGTEERLNREKDGTDLEGGRPVA